MTYFVKNYFASRLAKNAQPLFYLFGEYLSYPDYCFLSWQLYLFFRTEVGYRELALSNKDLNTLLTKLQNAKSDEEKSKFLSELQPVFTFAIIATDECDFGTGIELGWNLLAHGIDFLNSTIKDFLVTGYRLVNREAFAKIAECHMENRRKGCNLSTL